MKKKLDHLSEEDFAVLRGPLESGRQSPNSLAGTLLLAPFLLIVILGLANAFVFTDRLELPHTVVVVICLICDLLGLIIIILSIIFSFKKIYQKRQRAQYLLSVVVVQTIIGFLYLVMLYYLFDDVQFHHTYKVSTTSMALFSIGTFLIGIFLFIVAFIRFLRLLKQGQFRKNTKRDQLRGKLEKQMKQYTIYGAVSVSSVFLTGIKVMNVDFEVMIAVSIGVSLFYIMMFILPEQLVIWYCKGRFKSFNFDENNILYAMSTENKQESIN